MIVLGVDTSTDHLGVGLADDGKIIFEDTLNAVQEHASQIIGMIDAVLSQAGVAKENLGGIAIADGPGSFTGLRIGMAAAKGMALALNIPIVGVSTFEVVARRLLSEYDHFWLTAMVRKGELYICRVVKNSDVRGSIELISQEGLPQKIASEPVGIIGREPDGWQELIINRIPADKLSVSGGELAMYGGELISDGKIADLASLEPFYIAPSQAEWKFGRS